MKVVLVVAADVGMLNLLEFVLGDLGVVRTAENLEGALALAEQRKPALTVLDVFWSWPESIDIGVLRRLKAAPVLKDVPLLALVTPFEPHDAAKEAGADCCLEKPFDVKRLYGIVYRYLDR